MRKLTDDERRTLLLHATGVICTTDEVRRLHAEMNVEGWRDDDPEAETPTEPVAVVPVADVCPLCYRCGRMPGEKW